MSAIANVFDRLRRRPTRGRAPTGTFGNRTAQNTPWTAPMQPGPVPVTVTVTCPTRQQDGAARHGDDPGDSAAAAKVYTFEDVHFDFDRYTLRPEALRVLEQAVAGDEGRRHAAPDASKATPAASARPNTTWRSASAAPTRCATT